MLDASVITNQETLLYVCLEGTVVHRSATDDILMTMMALHVVMPPHLTVITVIQAPMTWLYAA